MDPEFSSPSGIFVSSALETPDISAIFVTLILCYILKQPAEPPDLPARYNHQDNFFSLLFRIQHSDNVLLLPFDMAPRCLKRSVYVSGSKRLKYLSMLLHELLMGVTVF